MVKIQPCITGSSSARKARQQLRAFEKPIRRNIGYRMELMREDLRGDVKKLEAKGEWREVKGGFGCCPYRADTSSDQDPGRRWRLPWAMG
jgi:hypothetical protein